MRVTQNIDKKVFYVFLFLQKNYLNYFLNIK